MAYGKPAIKSQVIVTGSGLQLEIQSLGNFFLTAIGFSHGNDICTGTTDELNDSIRTIIA